MTSADSAAVPWARPIFILVQEVVVWYTAILTFLRRLLLKSGSVAPLRVKPCIEFSQQRKVSLYTFIFAIGSGGLLIWNDCRGLFFCSGINFLILTVKSSSPTTRCQQWLATWNAKKTRFYWPLEPLCKAPVSGACKPLYTLFNQQQGKLSSNPERCVVSQHIAPYSKKIPLEELTIYS